MPSRSSLTPAYSFDNKSGRYRDNANGRFLSSRNVVSALETQIDASRSAMAQVTESLRNNRISLSDWRSEMVNHIKTIHVAQYAAGQGGWAQMTASDYGRIGNVLKEQYRYLNGFTHDLQEQMFSKGGIDRRADARAGLYAEAGHATFEASRRLERFEAGMGYERRVLGSAEHCSDCVEYADRGWQPLHTLPAIGDSQCHSNCRCTFEYAESLQGDMSDAVSFE